jgi:hypothetical protein
LASVFAVAPEEALNGEVLMLFVAAPWHFWHDGVAVLAPQTGEEEPWQIVVEQVPV